MNYYFDVLKKYVVFEGRARRKEFWMFTLISFIISIILAIIDGIIHIRVLGSLYAILVLLPSIAVGVRRMHDIDKSGWWLLLLLIPIIGWIILLVLACLDSYPGDNKYGPNPKGVSAVSSI